MEFSNNSRISISRTSYRLKVMPLLGMHNHKETSQPNLLKQALRPKPTSKNQRMGELKLRKATQEMQVATRASRRRISILITNISSLVET